MGSSQRRHSQLTGIHSHVGRGKESRCITVRILPEDAAGYTVYAAVVRQSANGRSQCQVATVVPEPNPHYGVAWIYRNNRGHSRHRALINDQRVID